MIFTTRWLVVAALGVAAACSFSGGAGDNKPGTDASSADSMGSVDAADEEDGPCTLWGERAFFTPCTTAGFNDSNSPGDLTIDDDWTYDTDDNVFIPRTTTSPSPTPTTFLANFGSGPVRVWLVDSFTLTIGNDLSLTGAAPLVIASLGGILIEGDIDASSEYVLSNNVPDFAIAAGQSQTDCTDLALLRGEDDDDGGAGGAGASFGNVGGNGGNGDNGDAVGPTALGAISVGAEMSFRGGCRGGDGGDAANGTAGLGGYGGGGVMLTAIGEIRVSGDVCAGGAAGHGQSAGPNNGAGGGGSGGLIVLEGPTINLASATIAANGGGAGGGAAGNIIDGPGSSSMLAGTNGRCDMFAANGAQGEGNVSGGRGAANLEAATNGGTGSAGGGGGGGGAGIILVVAPNRLGVTSAARSSPPPRLIDSNFSPLP